MKKTLLCALLAFSPCVISAVRAENPEKAGHSEKGEKDDDDDEKEEKSGKAGKEEKEDDEAEEHAEAIAAKMAKLPAPVAAALKTAAGTATINKLDEETDDGVTTYEIETSEKGKADREVTVDAAGKVLVEETTLAIADVPAAAKAAIEAGAKGAKIERINKMVRGAAVSYEALYVTGKKKTEVEYNADGSLRPE